MTPLQRQLRGQQTGLVSRQRPGTQFLDAVPLFFGSSISRSVFSRHRDGGRLVSSRSSRLRPESRAEVAEYLQATIICPAINGPGQGEIDPREVVRTLSLQQHQVTFSEFLPQKGHSGLEFRETVHNGVRLITTQRTSSRVVVVASNEHGDVELARHAPADIPQPFFRWSRVVAEIAKYSNPPLGFELGEHGERGIKRTGGAIVLISHNDRPVLESHRLHPSWIRLDPIQSRCTLLEWNSEGPSRCDGACDRGCPVLPNQLGFDHRGLAPRAHTERQSIPVVRYRLVHPKITIIGRAEQCRPALVDPSHLADKGVVTMKHRSPLTSPSSDQLGFFPCGRLQRREVLHMLRLDAGHNDEIRPHYERAAPHHARAIHSDLDDQVPVPRTCPQDRPRYSPPSVVVAKGLCDRRVRAQDSRKTFARRRLPPASGDGDYHRAKQQPAPDDCEGNDK